MTLLFELARSKRYLLGMTTYFTSDLHFGHTRYAPQRGFRDTDEMDSALVAGWNGVVQPRDTVYVLGDVALCRPERATELVSKLNGRKHLIFGNHDRHLRKNSKFLVYFESANDLLTIKLPDNTVESGMRLIVLCHYPLVVWDRSHYGSFSLCGHSHGTLPDDPHSLRLDVGVDVWNFQPVSFEAIRARMSQKTWKPVDGHGRSGDDAQED